VFTVYGFHSAHVPTRADDWGSGIRGSGMDPPTRDAFLFFKTKSFTKRSEWCARPERFALSVSPRGLEATLACTARRHAGNAMATSSAFIRSVPQVGGSRPKNHPSVDPARSVLRERIARTFHTHDTDATGFLDRHGFKCAFASLVGSVPSKLEVEHVFERNARLGLEVFAGYLERRLANENETSDDSWYARNEKARVVFRAFDSKQAGYLTLEDAEEAFKTVLPGISREIVCDVFREADEDGDGKVGLEAFSKIFLRGSA